MVDANELRDKIVNKQVKKFDSMLSQYKESNSYEKEIHKCIQCGYCRNTSATYHINQKESESHPGRMFLLNHPEIQSKENTIRSVYHMTTGIKPEVVCPANIKHENAFSNMRAKLFDEAIQYDQFENMKLAMDNLNNPNKENHFGKKKELKFNWLSEKQHVRADYLYFVGCNDLLNNHNTVRKVLWLLNKFKIPYTISKQESCCGHFARSMGDITTADKYAQKLRYLVQDYNFKTIIVSCPHCLEELKNIFKDRNVEIIHIMELINNKIKLLGSGKIHKLKARVSYIDPCYLAKNYPDEMPRRILKNLGADVIEKIHSKRESYCCGAGDGFDINYPEDAQRIATTHFNEAIDAKSDYVVTNCSYCFNLMSKTHKIVKPNVKIIDFLSLVVKAIKWTN